MGKEGVKKRGKPFSLWGKAAMTYQGSEIGRRRKVKAESLHYITGKPATRRDKRSRMDLERERCRATYTYRSARAFLCAGRVYKKKQERKIFHPFKREKQRRDGRLHLHPIETIGREVQEKRGK